MDVNILKLNDPNYPLILRDISDPPSSLYWAGSAFLDLLDSPKLAVVGSRKATSYGQYVTSSIVGRLAKAGVTVISGMAYGIDAVAHKAALDANGQTIAVLPSGLDKIYPAAHYHLANKILNNGALVSEYPPGSETYKLNFIARNRIVSGLADALLITEAAANSGTLHTARFALEQGKTVMAIPGNITSPSSEGCNNLIKSGALPVTNAEDIFFALNIRPAKQLARAVFKGSKDEQLIFDLIRQGVAAQEELAINSRLDGQQIAAILTLLEINGYIRPTGAGQWVVA